MSMQTDIAAIKVEMREVKDDIAEIKQRLKAGDERFRADDRRQAAEEAQRRLAMKLGTWALMAVGAVGMWMLQQVPALWRLLTTRI